MWSLFILQLTLQSILALFKVANHTGAPSICFWPIISSIVLFCHFLYFPVSNCFSASFSLVRYLTFWSAFFTFIILKKHLHSFQMKNQRHALPVNNHVIVIVLPMNVTTPAVVVWSGHWWSFYDERLIALNILWQQNENCWIFLKSE